MTCYLVYRASGSWDDYTKWVEAVFEDESEAATYADKFNERLKRIQDWCRERMPKDEQGDLDMDKPNWLMYHYVLQHKSAFVVMCNKYFKKQ